MMKRNVILIWIACVSIAVFSVQSLSQTQTNRQRSDLPDLKRQQKMTEAQRRRYAARRRAQRRKESEQIEKESEKTKQQLKLEELEREKKLKQRQEKMRETKRELLLEKYALKASEEQWKVIKPKLEKVRLLRDRARSTVGLLLGSSSRSGSDNTKSAIVPAMQWNPSWKKTNSAELTDAQKIANRLMDLVDQDETTDEQFSRQMAALRQCREKQKALEDQWARAREELRKNLTTRQEAALILMGWL
jgi:flagellar biosynthesis GTPase FlhF